jgi:hypothetical protein
MVLPRSSTLTAIGLLFLTTSNAVSFDCGQVVVGDLKLDLLPLAGPHSVFMLQQTPTGIKNTTFTLDICRPLVKSSDSKVKGCDNGARGMRRQEISHRHISDTI